MTNNNKQQVTFLDYLQTDVFFSQYNWRKIFHHTAITKHHNNISHLTPYTAKNKSVLTGHYLLRYCMPTNYINRIHV